MASRLPGRPDPAAQVRGGRPARGAAAQAGRADAAARRAHRQAGGGVRGSLELDRPDRSRSTSRSGSATGVAVLGAERLGQVALPAAARARRLATPTSSTEPVGDVADRAGARTPGRRGSARGCGPGWFAQTHEHPELVGRTLLEILHRGDEHRDGLGRGRRRPGCWTATSWRAPSEQSVRVALRRSAGPVPDPAARAVRRHAAAARRADRQPRPGARPRRSRTASTAFEGTVLAVTHDRWFARGFDRFLVFGADGRSTSPTTRSGTRPVRCADPPAGASRR